MSITLNPIFQALGYRSEAEQRDLIKLLEASGAFGELPGVDGIVNDRQAQGVLANVTFENAEAAAHWLHDATQAHMLRRPPGVEDYQCDEPEHFRLNRGELLNTLHRLGALAEVKPQAKHYDHVLVLGAMEGTVSTRLDMLRELYDDGVRFDKIHLLGSERPLDPEHEPIGKIAIEGGAKLGTEMQMMIARAYEKSELWPEGLQQVKINSITTPNQEHGRANTRDTIVSWLQTKPQPGRVLVISTQPNVAYQDAAVKSVLPPEFTVDTVGARLGEDGLKISLAMDAIARRIDVSFPRLLETLKTQPPVLKTPLIGVDPASVKVDAAVYQFRSGGDHAGVTGKGRYDADHWDPILHGDPILVHERLDGSLFVADGHHRLDLAKRLNAQGTGPGNILAMVLSEKQGYTPQDVKIIAAYKNIAHMTHGNNDPASIVDAARVFREAEQLPFDHKKLLPYLRLEGDVELSYHLRGLTDPALDMVARGDVPAQAAAVVARRVNEPDQQDAAMRSISAQLRQNYDNYAPRPGGYETHIQMHGWPVKSQTPSLGQPQPDTTIPQNAMPGFLAKLQQQRAALAARGIG